MVSLRALNGNDSARPFLVEKIPKAPFCFPFGFLLQLVAIS